GLVAIICVGESAEERDGGRQEDIVGAQLKDSVPGGATPQNTVIAYEPVWAIGTGKTATANDIAAMHGFIRGKAGEGMRLLYGGSVKADTAGEILSVPNVDGVLVGGARLDAQGFLKVAGV